MIGLLMKQKMGMVLKGIFRDIIQELSQNITREIE